MPNDDNKIILEFPATNVEIELGETITFDNISGFLNSDRVTYDGESLTDEITHLENDKADASYVNTELAKKADKTDTYTKTQVDNALNNKMNKANPTGTGSMSVGSGITMFGSNSQAFGSNHVVGGSDNFVAGVGHNIVYGSNRFVFGSYSKGDVSCDIIEVVGNGTSGSNRSNARTLDKNGNETLAGNLTFNGNKSLTSEISRLDGRIDNLPAPMVFKGTLGTDGTIEVLPVASDYNEGWTYKVITDGTYAGQTAKVGDVFTSNGSAWVYIPSGDEDNDTWRAIKVNGVEKLGNGISSGAVDFEDTTNVKFEFDDNGNKVRARLDGIYTESDVDDLLDDKADADNIYTKEQVDDIVYNILPDDTASGGVANFTTSLELPIKSLEIDVNAVQSAGTPTPASPLPISGWNEISLTKCGVNLWDEETENGYLSSSDGSFISHVNSICSKNFRLINPSAQVYVATSTDKTLYICWYDEDKTFISRAVCGNTSVTSPLNARYFKLSCYNYGSTYNNDTSVNYPSNDTTYHAYNAATEVINLGGTYYGGHFTQDKDGHRQLTVTYGIADISELSWNRYNFSGVYCFYVNMPLMKTNYAKGLSSAFEFKSNIYNPSALSNNQFLLDNGTHNGYCYLRCDDYSDAATFKTAMAGQKLIYELATPYTIDLPDGEPIITLIGTNNIYADTGDCAVEYKCSVAEYVANHSGGGGAKSLGGVFLGGSNSGSEEEPAEESEETEKTKEIDEPKEEIKTIGDMKKLGGE